MRSKTFYLVGLLVLFTAAVSFNGCEETEPESVLGIQPISWQDQAVHLPADGISTYPLMATVITDEGKKVQNVAVTFTSVNALATSQTLGSFTQATVTTDADGQATATLIAPESAVDLTALVDASVTDTTGYILNPRTNTRVAAEPAPPGAVAIVSAGPLDDEELEARLHAILLDRAREQAAERRKGMGALLGDAPVGQGGGAAAAQADELTVVFEGVIISLSSNKTQLPADGVSKATIEARVRTTAGLNVSGATLNFSARHGKITSSATTDEYGSAEVDLTSAVTTVARDTIRARLGVTLIDTLYQDFVQPVLTVTSDAASIAADGSSTTTVRARLLTPAGNPIQGAEVAFALTGPDDVSITVQGTTNTNGEATAVLKAGNTAGSATVTASFSGLSESTTVNLLGLSVQLASNKSSILANGTSTATVTMIAKTQTTNVAIVNQLVTWSTDLGTIPATSTTNSSGVATATLKSSTSPGTATVSASIGDTTLSTTVTFSATANISVELSSDEDRLLRDGQDETAVTARVVDGEGNALSGRVVTFSLSGVGSLSTLQPQQTGVSGTASVDLLADAATADGTATIIATAEGQSDTLDVPLRGVTLVMTSAPSAIVANGNNTSKISLLVKETTTNAGVTGRSLQFASSLGTIPSAATTNASGVATVTLTSGTTAGTATVTATLGTLNQTTDVDFLAEALSLTLSAGSGSILRDGVATTAIQVLVQDPNGNNLSNRDVTWSLTGGSSATLFPAVGQTGSSGTHSTTLTADAAATDAVATVTATVGDSTTSVSINLRGVTLTSFVQPDTILANSSETAEFRWQASETTTGAIIANHDIIITKVSGPSVLLSNLSSTTDGSGIAKVTVQSTQNAGDLVMQAELGGVTQGESLHLLQDQYSLALTTDNPTMLRDGIETADLTAVVLDKLGNAVTDQRVDFTVAQGAATLSSSFERTDSSGEATVTLTTDVGQTTSNARIIASVSTVADSVDIPLYGVILSIKTDPDSLVADNETAVNVSVTVKEAGSSTPLVGRTVYFAIGPGTFGTITAQATTNSSGVATATLTGDTTASFVGTVYGRLGEDPTTALTANTTIDVVAPTRGVRLSAADEWIIRNNQDSTTLTATVTDNTGYPVEGASVTWSLTGATPAGASLSVAVSQTNSSGQATVVLTGDAGGTDATATVQAAVGSATDTHDVPLQGVVLAISALPSSISANGVDLAVIEATLTEATTGRGVTGETLTFSTSLGTIGGTAETDANGKATVNLTAGTTAGSATVQVYSGPVATGISNSTTVTLVDPVAASLALTTSQALLQVKGTGGIESATITATVLDKDNKPVPPGVEVEFVISPAAVGTFGGTAVKDTITTDTSGEASVQFQSGTLASDATITATVLGTSVVSQRSLLSVTAGPVQNIDIAATVISWNDEGLYERELHGVFADTFGNAVENTYVVWTASPDTAGTILGAGSEDGYTDENGVAHSLYVYSRGCEPLPLTIYVTTQGVTDSLVIPQGAISVTGDVIDLYRDGQDSASLTASLVDGYGTPVGLVGLSWTVSAGTGVVAAAATATNQEGDPASNTYVADANTVDGTGTVEVEFRGITDTVDFDLYGVTITASASPDTLSANGAATSTVTAMVKETTANRALSGALVVFDTDLGTIGSAASTDANGKAQVTFTAGTTTGPATVTATYGGLSTTTGVELISSTSAAIALEASETALQVKGTGGTELSVITATVWDCRGNLVPTGTAVSFAVTPDGTFCSNNQDTTTVITDDSGKATVVYQSGTESGNKVFTATSGSAVGSAPLITVAAGPVSNILIGSEPYTANAGDTGITTTSIAVLVSDAYANPVVEETEVHFELTGANADKAVVVTWVQTDETGVAATTISYPTAEAGVSVTLKVTCGGVTEQKTFALPTP